MVRDLASKGVGGGGLALACFRRSDSGERCKVKRSFQGAFFTSHRSPLTERLEQATVRQEARLPEDKHQKCRAMLQNFQARRSTFLKELQSLIGLLNCLVVVPGRAFPRRMIDLTEGVNKRHHHIPLSRGTKLDIILWLRFLDDFNGRSLFLSDARGGYKFRIWVSLRVFWAKRHHI